MYSYISVILIGFGIFGLTVYQQNDKNQMEQYIYVLKLKKKFLDRENWTEKENETAAVHFEHLKRLTKEGTVILAGRTLNTDESQFGIVILETESREQAKEIMESDPALKRGLMTAKLFPYRIATKRMDW